MPSVRLGLEAVLYRNTGTHGSPTLVKVDNVKDVTLNLEKNSADVTTRGNNGWRAMVGVLKDATIDFAMVWNTSDANFAAIRDAFLASDLAGQTIEFFVMSADVDLADSEGLRASFMVEKFSKKEPLEDAQGVDVTIRPTFSDYAPAWVTGGAYAAYD
jgi:hypothetical protein